MRRGNFISRVAGRYWRQPTRNLKRTAQATLVRTGVNGVFTGARARAALAAIQAVPDFGNEFVSEGLAASIILPSRGRPNELRRGLKNIAETAGGQVEILVRLDDDDSKSLEARESFHAACAPIPMKIVVGPRGGGYRDLHHFVNDLSSLARGDFLVLFNDDAVFDCKGWGKQIAKWRKCLSVLQFRSIMNGRETPLNIFPAVHRKIFQILGHFSLQNHNDSWIEEVARAAGCHHFETWIKLIHMQEDSKDSTFSDARHVEAETTPEFYNEENTALRQRDVLNISAHIIRHGNMLRVVEKR